MMADPKMVPRPGAIDLVTASPEILYDEVTHHLGEMPNPEPTH
jgi:hypothetical protein